MERVDSLLQELARRHHHDDPRFLTAVRPLAASILHPDTPAAARVRLLELLAETFERDARVRRDGERARSAWRALTATILRALRR